MSLDSKKFEIQKLLELSRERQMKYEEDEKDLIRDVKRFDNFLTENDISAINAINLSEEEKKKKIEGKKQLFVLSQNLKMIELEIKKIDEQLDDCKEYQSFLNKVKSSKNEPVTDDDNCEMFFKRPEQLLEHFREFEENNLSLMKTANDIERQLEDTKKEMRDTMKENEARKVFLGEKAALYRGQLKTETERGLEIERKLRRERESESGIGVSMDELRDQIRGIFSMMKLKNSIKSNEGGDSVGIEGGGINDDEVSQQQISWSMDPLQMLARLESEIEKMIAKIEEFAIAFDEKNFAGSSNFKVNILQEDVNIWISKTFKLLEKQRRQEIREKMKSSFDAKELNKKQAEESSQKDKKVQKTLVDSHLDVVNIVPKRSMMFRSPPVEKKVDDSKKNKQKAAKKDDFFELFGI